MTGKRKEIIESAIRLFADKGYHATSIQEIADSVGISKGSMYSWFESKEELLLSIYRHYSELFEYRMASFALRRGLPPRDKLIRQTAALFDQFAKSREFFLMQLKEQVLANLKESGDFMYKMIVKAQTWYSDTLLEMFGENIRPYVNDCAAVLNGMVGEYLKYTVFYGLKVDYGRVAEFIVERLEDVVDGIMRRSPAPVLEQDEVEALLSGIADAEPGVTERLQAEFKRVRSLLAAAPSDRPNGPTTGDLIGSLDMIEAELAKDEPSALVIRGMNALLMQSPHPETTALCEMIEKLADSL